MRTIILPGMGANSNMYPKEQYKHLENVTFINWPRYEEENSLTQVAHKIIKLHKIDNNTVIGGSSLGGMVAIEIGKIVNCKKVILIGSATTPEFINPLLKRLSNFAQITPIKLIQLFTGKVNQITQSELFGMFEKSEEQFIKAMCKALFKWEGINGYNGQVHHIHGEKDLVIFPPEKNVTIISKGGHLISMSHSNVVANFINENRH